MAFPLIVDTARNAQGMFLVDPATGQPSSGSGSTSQNVQGAEATGVTQTAKPVVIGMTDATTGNVRVAVGSTTNSDGAPAGSGLNVRAHTYVFNGTSFDRLKKPSLTARIVSAAASTNATSVKASAGDVFRATGYNANAAARYLKIYNKASAPTVGTDVPVWTEYLAPQSKFTLEFPAGMYFSTGIALALTTGSADADTGALTAADILALNVAYA